MPSIEWTEDAMGTDLFCDFIGLYASCDNGVILHGTDLSEILRPYSNPRDRHPISMDLLNINGVSTIKANFSKPREKWRKIKTKAVDFEGFGSSKSRSGNEETEMNLQD